MLKLLKKFAGDESGGPAVEFALVGVFLALMMPSLVDVATMVDGAMRLSIGMRAAEQFALKYPNDTSGITTAATQASGISSNLISITSPQFCECDGASSVCSNSCGAGAVKATYVNLTVTYAISSKYTTQGALLFPSTLSKNIKIRVS